MNAVQLKYELKSLKRDNEILTRQLGISIQGLQEIRRDLIDDENGFEVLSPMAHKAADCLIEIIEAGK